MGIANYFYNSTLRKYVALFGTYFNQMKIQRVDNDGTLIQDMIVPISYAPFQKILARVTQDPNFLKGVAINLPRMSFEMTSIQYDSSRKAGVTQTFKATDGTNIKKVFMPVPYNIGFELNIFSKLNDDALQIVEQILPFFQPSFNLTLDLIDSIGEKRDTPVVLDSIDFQDDYEGSFQTRRALIYTLRFTVKTYLFGPIADSTDGLIRKVQVDVSSSTDIQTAKREVRYTVTPKALEDKNSDGQINSTDDALLGPSDDFGFNENWDFFQDSKTYSPTQQQDI